MEEWSKEIFATFESVAGVVDEFFLGVTEIVEDIADNLENTFGAEFEQFCQEAFESLESIVEIYYEFEEIAGEGEEPFSYPVVPDPTKHAACIGCRHYHGQVYGGNLLVCAMHPYGWDTENCPDWESMIE
ncbi:MAG: hypothetical protein F6K36_20465 [Symploca sp. SIO3C6]|uniref:Uncharacterized protein n=1 Tax=Symploca sp. SIO1C4 TaxID=2607765 RepID=A0A6B3NAT2_9CYAN|nr:hypothetical protein [Symploca sp. SIO3C6]NER26751.1 hypothetical protein [Symploca sp. SIO1C4]NET08222.1 hypothetical protein [Symploca sp. SIO2B6]NET51711.1 hypothetical protein [Merismopedia sp. SIO2A8]